MKNLRILLTLFLGSATIGNAQFQFTGGPVSNELPGGAIWASGDTCFAVYNELLYRTFNGGSAWELTSLPLNSDPRTVEVSQGRLIVGTNDGSRVYTSLDFGTSFTGGTGSLTGVLVATASTSGPDVMMIGGTNADPHLYDFQTNDWVSSGNGGITHGIGYLGGDTIWICSGGVQTGTTQYSHDLGNTWTSVTTEPVADVGGGVMLTTKATDFVRAGGNVIITTALNGKPVLYTSDNGDTWQASNLTGVQGLYGKRFLHIADDNVLLLHAGKLYQSTDQGATWNDIQTLNGAGSHIQMWKNDHVLISTSTGIVEFDNLGAGALVAQYDFPLDVKHLSSPNDATIYASTTTGLYEYEVASETWSFVNNEYENGLTFEADFSVTIGDSLYVCNRGLYVSGDDGATFTRRVYPDVGFAKINGMFELNGAWVLIARDYWNGGGAPDDPEIYISTDQGVTWTESTFTNNIALGFFGAENYINKILQNGNTWIADMYTGYAISEDSGATWTFSGSGTEITDVVVANNVLVRRKLHGFSLENRDLEISDDDGDSWTDIPTTGLPNAGGTNYLGFGPIFSSNGVLTMYNALEAPIGLYQFDAQANTWSMISGTEGIANESCANVLEVDGDWYATWQNAGVLSTGAAVVNGLEDKKSDVTVCYPNPVSHGEQLQFNRQTTFTVYSSLGTVMHVQENPQNYLDIPAEWGSGVYFIQFDGQSSPSRIVIQ